MKKDPETGIWPQNHSPPQNTYTLPSHNSKALSPSLVLIGMTQTQDRCPQLTHSRKLQEEGPKREVLQTSLFSLIDRGEGG